MRVVRTAAYVLNIYGQNSSLHGLYHLYQSNDIIRRIFWLIVLLLALAAGIFHTVKSAERYLNLDIFVHVSDEAITAEFPDVTLCNIKPFSESLLVHYSKIVDQHFEKRWNYFENWFLQQRQRRKNEGKVAHRDRLKKIFSRFLQIVWVSEDSRDLGVADTTSLLDCSYEGQKCGRSNFSLVRDPDSWNCYHFSPSKEIPVGTKGLQLVLFTDSNFFHPISRNSLMTMRAPNETSEVIFSNDSSKIKQWNSLKYFLQSRKRSLNQIASPSMVESDGFRVILHEPGSHSMTSLYRLEFEAGASGSISINQMIADRLNRASHFRCVKSPYKSVSYVTDFDTAGSITRRSYDKLLDAHVVEEKQSMVYKACGCYSHRYPFDTKPQSLCYYAPPEQRRQPTGELMDRMDCHDEAVDAADRQTYQLVKKHAHNTPCHSMLLSFSTNVYGWPKKEDIGNIANDYVITNFVNGTDLLPGDGRKHAIFNFSDSEIVKLVGNDQVFSRQQVILNLLMGGNISHGLLSCSHPNKASSNTSGRYDQDYWDIASNRRLKRNLLRLNIQHSRRKSRHAQEHYSYEWPEALSELGGVCGLWLGMSVLTIFELLEVAYFILTVKIEVPPSREASPRESMQISFRTSDGINFG